MAQRPASFFLVVQRPRCCCFFVMSSAEYAALFMAGAPGSDATVGSYEWCLARGNSHPVGTPIWEFARSRLLIEHLQDTERASKQKARAERELRQVKRKYKEDLEGRTVRACRRYGFDCHWHIPNGNPKIRESIISFHNEKEDGDWEMEEVLSKGCRRIRFTRQHVNAMHRAESLAIAQRTAAGRSWFFSHGTAVIDRGPEGVDQANAIEVPE